MKLSTALLNMLNLVKIGVLDFGRKIMINPASVNLGHKLARSIEPIDILFQ
jgi:hypothetical protein